MHFLLPFFFKGDIKKLQCPGCVPMKHSQDTNYADDLLHIQTHYSHKTRRRHMQPNARKTKDSLRTLNNLRKKSLLQQAVSEIEAPVITVLDCGAGSGQDLHKWAGVSQTTRRRIMYSSCDLCDESVREAQRRVAKLTAPLLTCDIQAGDALACLRRTAVCDLVCFLFSLQYMCRTIGDLRSYFHAMRSTVRPGGMLVIVLPIRERLEPRMGESNVYYSFIPQSDPGAPEYLRYSFSLQNCIWDCMEHAIPLADLLRCAEEYDFDTVRSEPWEDLSCHGVPLSHLQARLNSIYHALCFRRRP